MRKIGISVTTIGLGLGYNEDLMVRLAQKSDGNHAFVENSRDLARIFEYEFKDILSVVAQDVTIEINCREGVHPVRILGREADVIGNKVYTSLNQIYSNQEKYFLLEVDVDPFADGTSVGLADVKMSYSNMVTKKRENLSGSGIISFTTDTANNILISNNRILQNKFRMIENDLDQLNFDSSLTAREIRSETARVKLVNEVFIINSENKFIFPPEDGEMSQRERDFISEAKNIELINVLPQSEENDSSFKVHLSDARGNLLYQWGSYIPEESSEPIREFSLSEPLNSWRLFYYIDENSEEKSIIKNRKLLLFSGLIFMTIVIVLLSFYFYRENTREMAVARQQVTFVNQVSHELKTPLTNIRLYSELLQEKLIDKKQREFLDIIINEGSRLGRMINNVLTFSKGEQGELTKKNEETNISLLITEVLDKFKLQFTKNGMEISYEKTNLPMIQTDRDMIEQILINLVGNAVKYGVSGKFLAIKTEVFSAEDGLSAFDLYERENPDLLCLDIMMPGINGYDLCKKIRKKGDRTPVIFVSAKSEENDPSNPIEIETVPTAGYRHL